MVAIGSENVLYFNFLSAGGANNPLKTFEEVKKEGLGSKDQPDY